MLIEPIVALHGGAGNLNEPSYERESLHMRGCLEDAQRKLLSGASALDTVTSVVKSLEGSGLYIAGRGASPNSHGEYELDACIIDGATREMGSVAALQGFAHPIEVAREVLKTSPHVLFAGAGAARFAREHGCEEIADTHTWFLHAAAGEVQSPARATGTVGCVVRDQEGRLAAATSTGGVIGKLSGRVGDTPIPGAGTYADANVAISCTGIGEYFLRTSAAAQIAFRYRFGTQAIKVAAEAVLEEIVKLGGQGGCIVVTKDGDITMPFRARGMKRGMLSADGTIDVQIW